MLAFESTSTICASPDAVWAVLVDAAAWRTWDSGGMPIGLFSGVRTYTLTPKGTSTVFTMREEYTGPLSASIGKSIPDLSPSFAQFANGLKARVEAGR